MGGTVHPTPEERADWKEMSIMKSVILGLIAVAGVAAALPAAAQTPQNLTPATVDARAAHNWDEAH